MLHPDELKSRIEAALVGAEVEVRDLKGTGDHFYARVVAPDFLGRSRVEQHQIVYAPLQELLASGALHALRLETFTPEEWAENRSR